MDPETGSGMGKKSGFGMNIKDNFSESLETSCKAKKILKSLM
jgi:hypothetical protein